MTAHTITHGRANQLRELAEQMPDLELLKVLPDLIHRFSGSSYAHDRAFDALVEMAEEVSDDLERDGEIPVLRPVTVRCREVDLSLWGDLTQPDPFKSQLKSGARR